ncbi:MAG TPA: enoyl-CoA hydratase-related protein [Polyangiales bacterium]|nr:enoyl-CoA hydratase-related protein [Polyangiales bacterium]
MTTPLTLQLHEESAVAHVTLNRPDRLNALSAQVLHDLFNLVSELEARPIGQRPRALLLRGAGEKAFAAGADIAELSSLDPSAAHTLSRAGHRLGEALESASFPSIAVVQGFALGGGLELALCADLIFCSERARFGQPEINLGLIPGFGGTFRLAARVGPGAARRMIYTGEQIDATEAKRIGLVDAVFPAAELDQQAERVAATIAAKAPLAIARAKRCLRDNQFQDFATASQNEATAFGDLFGTEDGKEGMRAFLGKRPPSFAGR